MKPASVVLRLNDVQRVFLVFCFCCHNWTEGDAAGSSRFQAREAANYLQCTGQPHTKGLSILKCSSAGSNPTAALGSQDDDYPSVTMRNLNFQEL